MDLSDEVYSEVDFHQEENNSNSNQINDAYGDDDYIEDEFEESKDLQESKMKDTGSVAKVAKKEGVLEVVEADDGHEKALSSGSAFSEISVKDEAQEETKGEQTADAQILLDDQSEQTDQHVRGAVKQVSPARLNSTHNGSNEHPLSTRPLSMVDQQPFHADPEEQKAQLSSHNNTQINKQNQNNHSETAGTLSDIQNNETAITQFRNNIYAHGSRVQASSSLPANTSIPIQATNGNSIQAGFNQTVTDQTQEESKGFKAIQTVDSKNSVDLGKVQSLVKELVITSHDPVLVVSGGDKDMFSADFQIASNEHHSRKQTEIITQSISERPRDLNQGAISSQSRQVDPELVAASSGAMPETFREDSPESIHSKKPPINPNPSLPDSQVINQPVQWEKRQQKGLRAPRTNQINPLQFSQDQMNQMANTAAQSTGLFKPSSANNNASYGNKTAIRRKNQLSLNRQESEITYGTTTQSIGSQLGRKLHQGHRTSKAADQRPAWGGSGLTVAQNKQRLQTAQGQAPKPNNCPLKPVNHAAISIASSQTVQVNHVQNQQRQQKAYDKFVNRGTKSVNRNSGMLRSLPTGVNQHTQQPTQKNVPFSQTKSMNKFANVAQQNQFQSRSVRPNTSSAAAVPSNLPNRIHPGQRQGDVKGRYLLQSANPKQQESNRLNSQKQIKVPQSSYGLRPVTNQSVGFGSKRPSATTQQFTKFNSSAKSSFSKESSVKQLRMGNYMRGTATNNNSVTKFNANSSASFQRSQSRSKNMMAGKSPMRNPSAMSASRLTNQSRASLDQSNFGGQAKYPTINFKGDEDFAIKILDNMIQCEEDMQKGFSMYNRGKNLKKSLINPERVREYLMKVEKDAEVTNFADEHTKNRQNDQLISLEDQSDEAISAQNLQIMAMPRVPEHIHVRGDPDLTFLQDSHINSDKQWRLMIEYFKKNPDALMDAIPTPPGQEEDDAALADFRTGLTPKRGKAFKFGGNKVVNRPDYGEDMRGNFRSTSQMSARSSNHNRSKIYEQSPRVNSARSHHSSRSNSAQKGFARFNPNSSNQYSAAKKAQLNRSYSSQMSRHSNNSKLNNSQGTKPYEARGGRNGMRDAMNRSTSSINSNLSQQNKRLNFPGRAAGQNSTQTFKGPYANRQASARRGPSESSNLAPQQSQRSTKPQKDFRISKRSSRTMTSTSLNQGLNQQAKNRFQEKQLEEQKQQDQRKQHTERMRAQLKKNNGKNDDTTPTSGQKSRSGTGSKQQSFLQSSTHLTSNRILAKNSNENAAFASFNKTLLEYIDWKASYFYKQLIVRHTDDNIKWDSDQLITEDHNEYVTKLIRNYRGKKPNCAVDELLRLVPQMTRKCYNTIEMIYKEILTTEYWRIEYDQMRANDPHVCKVVPKNFTSQALKIITLDNLLNRVGTLKTFRKDIQAYLELIHQRELVLKQMHIAVESIQTENFFMSEEDQEANQALAQGLANQRKKKSKVLDDGSQQNPRQEMLTMGNNLVELTDQIIKNAVKFLKNFNKQFLHVKLEQLIFQEADYIDVAIKEVEEIGQIFLAYEIKINKLKNCHMYQKKGQVKVNDIKQRIGVKSTDKSNQVPSQRPSLNQPSFGLNQISKDHIQVKNEEFASSTPSEQID